MANLHDFTRGLAIRICGVHVAAALLIYVLSARAQTNDKSRSTPGEQARTAVERLLDHAKRKELDAVMQLVDVPWGEDGKRVIRQRDELSAFFRKTLQEENLADVEWKVGDAVAPADYRKEARPKEREVLDKVLTDADRIVRVVADGEHVVLYVRMRGNKAHVVGYAYPG